MNPIAKLRASAVARYHAADKSVLTNLAFLGAIALSTLLLAGVLAVGYWILLGSYNFIIVLVLVTAVAYVAGMTDRFAVNCHREIFGGEHEGFGK